MYSALYNLYKQNIFKLAKTLVVKSRYIPEAINNRLRLEGFEVIDSQPQTWRYYKNLAGDYHLYDLPKIRVTSMDTLEEIEFTKENLAVHSATAREYAYGTEYYKSLVSRYPDKERLILGILNPIDINKAIAARDGEIIYFDESLVEENETNLIPQLQTYIYRFLGRWVTPDYRYTHGLYIGAMLANMHLMTVEAIASIRQDNCKTNFVHSFHVKMYLASHGRLDKYIDALTIKQRLFLYRNIDYLEANAGKKATFDLLVQRLITERNYPLAAYDIHQNTANMPASISPAVELTLEPINTPRSFGLSDNFTVDAVLTKQQPLARENRTLQEYYRTDIEERTKLGPYGKYATSVLESSIDDISNNSIRTLEELLLNHWMYLSSHGLYNATVSYTNPNTGEKLLLSAKDAFVLWLYCLSNSYGIEITDIPTLQCEFVKLIDQPDFATLRAMSSKRYLKDSVVHGVLANNVSLQNNIISIDGFYSTIKQVHDRLRLHYYVWSNETSKLKHAFLKGTSLRLYGTTSCVFYANKTYAEWFSEKGIALGSLQSDEYALLAKEIFDNATGLSLNISLSLRDVHRSIIGLMTQLSSYAVHYISTINSEDILRMTCPDVLIGDIVNDVEANYLAPVATIDVHDVEYRSGANYFFNVNGFDDIRLKYVVNMQSSVSSISLSMTTTQQHFTYAAPVSVVGVRNIEFF